MNIKHFYLISLAVICLFAGCTDSNKVNILTRQQNAIEKKNISGYKLIINKKTNVSYEGIYSDGFKTGNWLYNINDEEFNISWEVLSLGGGLVINKPKNWKEVKMEKGIFSIKGPINKDTSQVIILQKHDLINDQDNLEIYKQKFFAELNDNYHVIDTSSQCFTNSGDEFLIQTFQFLNYNELYKGISVLNEKNSVLTEITYYFKSDDWKMHYNICLDFVNGVQYNDEFLTNHDPSVFDPLGFKVCY